MKIIRGDATCPIGPGVKIIAHVVNDIGKFGKGFALALARRFPECRDDYIDWHHSGENFALGRVQIYHESPYIKVAHMIAQRGLVGRSNPVPLKYDALEKCLKSLAIYADEVNEDGGKASVHMPKIGCGLGGGDFNKVTEIIDKVFANSTVPVTMYIL